MNERISSISRICKNLLKSSQLLGNLYFTYKGYRDEIQPNKDKICILVWAFLNFLYILFITLLLKVAAYWRSRDRPVQIYVYFFYPLYDIVILILLRFFIRVLELVDSESLWESFFNCCTSLPQAVTTSLVESALLILQKKVSLIKVIQFPI